MIFPKEIEFIISCDLETTGLDLNGACWITGSFGKLDPKTLETVDELELKSRPYHWDEEARRIHRIPHYKAMEFPERKETLDRLIDWLPKDRRFAFLCHASDSQFDTKIKQKVNAHFDFAMIKADFIFQERYYDFYKYFDHKKIISTVTIARERKLESAKLDDLCRHFNINLDHHEAKSDRLACESILRRFYFEQDDLFNERDGRSKLNSGVPEVQKNISMEEQQRFGV